MDSIKTCIMYVSESCYKMNRVQGEINPSLNPSKLFSLFEKVCITYQIVAFTEPSRWSLPIRNIERHMLFRIVPMALITDSASQTECKFCFPFLLSSNMFGIWSRLQKSCFVLYTSYRLSIPLSFIFLQ